MFVCQSCCEGLKELSSHIQLLIVEAQEMEVKMDEFKSGIAEQVDSLLATPLETISSTPVPDLIDL